MAEPIPQTEAPQRVAAPDEVITRVVRDIRAVKRDTDLQQVFGVVNVVLEAFFDGDFEVYRRRGEDDPSLAKVAEHTDLPFSPETLYRFFRITDMADRIGGLHQFPHLDISHFREVLGVPAEQQLSLLKEANAGHWTVDQLNEAVSPTRPKSEKDATRHLHVETQRALRDLTRIADDKNGLLADLARAELAPESRRRLAELLGEMRTELQKVNGEIAERMQSASPRRRTAQQ